VGTENPGRTRSHFFASFFFTMMIDEKRRGAIASVAEKKVSASISIGGVLVADKRYEYLNVWARTRLGRTCCCLNYTQPDIPEQRLRFVHKMIRVTAAMIERER